jgi:hypothetical protein
MSARSTGEQWGEITAGPHQLAGEGEIERKKARRFGSAPRVAEATDLDVWIGYKAGRVSSSMKAKSIEGSVAKTSPAELRAQADQAGTEGLYLPPCKVNPTFKVTW